VLAVAVAAAGGGAVVPGVVSGSALAASDPGSYHVFSVSPTGNLYQDTWSGSWGGWQDLGNDGVALTGSPGIVYNPSDGTYHAYAIGTNGNVYQDLYTPGVGWGTWQNLGGGLQGGVNATYISPTTSSNCTPDNSCSPQTFADAVFGTSGINAPVTAANEYAFEVWEQAEGGGDPDSNYERVGSPVQSAGPNHCNASRATASGRSRWTKWPAFPRISIRDPAARPG
jgi:hypothetical protein